MNVEIINSSLINFLCAISKYNYNSVFKIYYVNITQSTLSNFLNVTWVKNVRIHHCRYENSYIIDNYLYNLDEIKDIHLSN